MEQLEIHSKVHTALHRYDVPTNDFFISPTWYDGLMSNQNAPSHGLSNLIRNPFASEYSSTPGMASLQPPNFLHLHSKARPPLACTLPILFKTFIPNLTARLLPSKS